VRTVSIVHLGADGLDIETVDNQNVGGVVPSAGERRPIEPTDLDDAVAGAMTDDGARGNQRRGLEPGGTHP
jgi:hypothetical protein